MRPGVQRRMRAAKPRAASVPPLPPPADLVLGLEQAPTVLAFAGGVEFGLEF